MEGSSEMNPYIDSSVGGLVWVRRRNGSWWPGRILGAEELPGSHLLSPRTGTPVKLLGREDGSVDWYNIEKSRRVKAFRCGDFDQCIERAKSLASVLTKKREKYARREDAILHALELERKYSEQNHLLGRSLSSLDRNYKELDFADDDMVLDVGIEGISHHSNFRNDFMDPESSTDAGQASLDSLFSLQGDRKFLEWEDEIAETIPRMRGLQDFGLRIISSKDRKSSWSASYEPPQNTSFIEDENKIVGCITKNTAVCPPVGLKASSPVSKKKRSLQVGAGEDESAYKKRDKRKPFTRVLETSVKLSDDAIGLSSNISSIIPASGRNGYVIAHPKQENLIHASERKSMAGDNTSSGWQASEVEVRSSHEMIDSSVIMGRPCSTFSDQMKSNCADGRRYQYGGSEVEVSPLTGSAFVDSILQGGTGLRCTYFQGSAFTGSVTGMSDTSLDQTSSLSMAENLPSSLPNFPVWSNFTHKEENEFGLRGQIASQAMCVPDYPFENAEPNNVLPIYPLYSNRIEENSVFAKQSAYDGEGPSGFCRSNTDLDTVTADVKPSRQFILDVAETDGGIRTREDEADSLQPISGPSSCSAKGTRAKQKSHAVSPNFDDSCRTNDLRIEVVTQSFQTGEEGSDDDDDGAYAVQNRIGLPDKYTEKASSGMNVSKWQTKGKRRVSVRSGNMWESTSVRALIDGVARESDETTDAHGLTNGAVNGSRRELRPKVEAASISEDEGELLDVDLEPQEAAHNDDIENSFWAVNKHISNRESPWFDVPVETQPISALPEEHAPFVSLTSKLNGKSILGQPMVVEIMQKRLRDIQNGVNIAKKPPLQPVWRTARRTAMQRIPRSCSIVLSRPHGQEVLDKQHQRGLAGQKNRVTRSSPLASSASANKRRPLKKGGSLPRKTRMLSSIAVQHSEINAPPVAASIKPSGPALVTCIPVNLIFNRIREVLYRGSNRALSDSDNNNT